MRDYGDVGHWNTGCERLEIMEGARDTAIQGARDERLWGARNERI